MPTNDVGKFMLFSGKYVGNRPIKLRKSKWQERIDYEAVESHKVRFLPR